MIANFIHLAIPFFETLAFVMPIEYYKLKVDLGPCVWSM